MHLSALTLIVPDYDSAIAYYCDVMGFVLTEDIDQGRKRWVRVTPPGGGTGFISLSGASSASARPEITIVPAMIESRELLCFICTSC